jgi:hypothetical protein
LTASERRLQEMRSVISVESIEEFINPRQIRVANRHLVIMLILFTIISMADAMTTIRSLTLGGTERNLVMILLLHIYGPQVLFTSKLVVIGGISGGIGILWKWKGIHPYRFFWVLTSITLATICVVMGNLTVIFGLLHG